jgi:hypothetical protein
VLPLDATRPLAELGSAVVHWVHGHATPPSLELRS